MHSPTPTPLFHSWLAAEKAARASERELHTAMLQFAAGEAPAPLGDLVQRASEQRAAAACLFPQAMQELKQIAESLRHAGLAAHPSPASPGDVSHSTGAASARPADHADGISSPSA